MGKPGTKKQTKLIQGRLHIEEYQCNHTVFQSSF